MVLDNLGDSLKQTFRKIAGLGTVDKQAVEVIVRDLQRSLLQADVDVSLVAELSSKIKKQILESKPPTGLTLKEYFIKTLYEEMVVFLGQEKGEMQLKPQKILLAGLFGSGKCVHPESNIILSDGSILTVGNLYDEYKRLGEKAIDEGDIIDVSSENLFVPSFNSRTLKMENKKVTHLWKLHGKDLLKISLDNGNDFSVRVTPEHPFFVMREGELKQIRADELNGDDFVAIPRKYECVGKLVDLYPYMKDLNLLVYENPETARKEILSKYSTLKEAHKNLRFKRNYCKFTTLLKNGAVPLQLAGGITTPLKLKRGSSQKVISFPRYLNSDLAEFLGYVIGDGYVHRLYIDISNEDPEIIRRVDELSHCLFGIVPEIRKDDRTKNMHRIRITSKTLVDLLHRVFGLPPGKKGKYIKIPRRVMATQDDIVRVFLKAYFDCDSYASEGMRQIELTSESEPLILQTASLLLRFNIVSTVSKKVINEVPYWRLSIRARYAETYAEKIGFNIKRKQERADQYKRIGIGQGCGKQDMIPLTKTLKEIRQSLGFSIANVQEYVTSYGRYESQGLISRESLEKAIGVYDNFERGKMLHILKNSGNDHELMRYHVSLLNSVLSCFRNQGLISKNNTPTPSGVQFLNQRECYPISQMLTFVKCLADSDVCWSRVNEVEPCDNKDGFVYDLTVEDNHSFIADNIIVHNTTTSGKLGRWFKVRGMSVGLVACDTHRPAAQEQLRQIGHKLEIPVYHEGKKPEDIAKNALKTAKEDILIFDSAGRDALDKELAKELENMGKVINPQEVLLVIPADIGQAARKQTEEFNKLVGITGVIVTKLDGTAKGGGALAASSASRSKVKFIGVGEKTEDLEAYDPQRFVSRLIGYGDLQGLLEKAKEVGVSEESAKKIIEGKFTLNEFMEQISAMQKMGPLTKIAEMIPGVSGMKIPKDMLDVQQEKMKMWKHIMNSMTPAEKDDPEIIKHSRIVRIARGSGTREQDVREILKYYKQVQKFMKIAKGGKGLKRGPLARMVRQMGLKLDGE